MKYPDSININECINFVFETCKVIIDKNGIISGYTFWGADVNTLNEILEGASIEDLIYLDFENGLTGAIYKLEPESDTAYLWADTKGYA